MFEKRPNILNMMCSFVIVCYLMAAYLRQFLSDTLFIVKTICFFKSKRFKLFFMGLSPTLGVSICQMITFTKHEYYRVMPNNKLCNMC